MTDTLAPLAALIVAAMFALAAVAKTTARPATAAEFAGLGLPSPEVASRVVPPVELALAALILFRPSIGGPLAALVLLAFTMVLALALRSGRSVTCGCLGPLSRRPVSAATLARNGALIGLALLATAAPAPTGWRPALPAGDLVLAIGPTVLLVALGAQLMTLRTRIGRIWSVELAGETNPPSGGSTNKGAAT